MSENLFDGIQDSLYSTIGQTFGYNATWLPEGDDPITGRVLFRNPTEKEKLSMSEYNPKSAMMEYHQGTFPGLFEKVRDSSLEKVTISSKGSYLCRYQDSIFDGKTYIIHLTPDPDVV